MGREMEASVPRDDKPKVSGLTLADVDRNLRILTDLAASRRRDLRSAVARVAALVGEAPDWVPLDLPEIAITLAGINAAAAGITPKTLSNIRSDFLAAVRASQLLALPRPAKGALSAPWVELMAKLKDDHRARIGLSRLAHHASAAGISPGEINDAVIDQFIADVRKGSLHARPDRLHRRTATIWNEVARQLPALKLQAVTVPAFGRTHKRIRWSKLSQSFRDDLDDYLNWCSGQDPFADHAPRVLALRTLKLRRNQVHAAVTALVQSGVEPTAITSIADLVTPENFKRILRRRHEVVDGRENSFNRDLAKTLIRIARQWTTIDAVVLAELTHLVGRIPVPTPGLTVKNRKFLRQFDDPVVLQRLYKLPSRLWNEIKRDAAPSSRTLIKAQAALGIAILCYMPLRLQNLAGLRFDHHVFLRESPNVISSLELSAAEVKNRIALAFDIPPEVTKMLSEYRNRIAPKIIGQRPDRLFVNADGTQKKQATVASIITNVLNERGIACTCHQFRHLSAKVMLDAQPGSFEAVRQLLGHRSLTTTVGAYAGIDSRRAARHHQRLVEKALEADTPMRRPKRSVS
jgi:integrase